MANGNKNDSQRFKENERILTYGLIADAVIFLLYLLMAGLGIAWLKWVLAIAAFLLSTAGLASLYLTGEIRRQRSLYLTVGFAAVVVCILFSLILNYPCPSEVAKAVGDAAGNVGEVPDGLTST